MQSPWPTLRPVRARELRNALPEPRDLEAVARNVTTYPGGGDPAYKLREAARLLSQAREWLDEAAAVKA